MPNMSSGRHLGKTANITKFSLNANKFPCMHDTGMIFDSTLRFSGTRNAMAPTTDQSNNKKQDGCQYGFQ
jgi:hypothetical protein